jgi:serine/threonine protein kinase
LSARRYNCDVLIIGSTISHYKIVEKLGEGGMGVAYKAENATLERSVALKFPADHLLNDTDAKERFLREAKAGLKSMVGGAARAIVPAPGGGAKNRNPG